MKALKRAIRNTFGFVKIDGRWFSIFRLRRKLPYIELNTGKEAQKFVRKAIIALYDESDEE